tara:strand:+ start:1881 stop:2327 length:447 start_codon:yes stop_codon:yes gene_type:complete
VKKKEDIEKSHNPYEIKVRAELETVYVTSSGSKYLKKMDALCAESQIQQASESREKRRKRIMDMVDILIQVLKENNWGVFYKSKPMQTLTLQDDSPLLKINEVDAESVENAVLSVIEKLKTKDLKDWAMKETEDTIPHSPIDLNPTED